MQLHGVLTESLLRGAFQNGYQKSSGAEGVKGNQRLIWPHCHMWADFLENVGSLTFHNPMGLHGMLQG
jgi:hypothetical protein